MKLRVLATVGVIALGAVLAGCAGTPQSVGWEVGNKPQILLPGAVRSDVKGLAMGSARSKGWSIVRSTDDQLVMQRPLDPASATAVALGAAGSAIPPVIEVTSAFLERSDGTLVALGAEVITQPPGEKAPKRLDYTENYRDALDASLESLRANWTANRQRVANAVPPESSQSEDARTSPEGLAEPADPRAQAWGNTVAEERADQAVRGGQTVPEGVAAAPAPEPRVVTPTPAPVPATTPPPPAEPVRPQQAEVNRGAPVIDGSSAVGAQPQVPRAPSPPPETRGSVLLPPVPEESLPPEQNMLTLNQAAGTGTWAYYAEQYARLRGCTLTDQGSQLVETRSDGEIHRVPCVGADSYLLKCQNGVCRGLE